LLVFAIGLNRRNLVENTRDLIRRKFSIDAPLCAQTAPIGASTISKPYRTGAGNFAFTIRAE
jgi:hypothetical protein